MRFVEHDLDAARQGERSGEPVAFVLGFAANVDSPASQVIDGITALTDSARRSPRQRHPPPRAEPSAHAPIVAPEGWLYLTSGKLIVDLMLDNSLIDVEVIREATNVNRAGLVNECSNSFGWS